MKIRHKLFVSFLSFAIIVAIVGFVGLIASKQIILSFEGGEQHFRTIVSAATEVANSVKRAESNLMLYLLLHDKIDKVKFFNRFLSLKEQITLLDELVKIPEERIILDVIKFNANELLPVGKTLIETHDKNIASSGTFYPEDHKALLRSFHNLTSTIRREGIELANFETDFLNRQEAITSSTEISNFAKMAGGHLMLYLAISEKSDLDDFFQIYDSLRERISILRNRIKNPEARDILERIESNTAKLLPISRSLINKYNEDVKTFGRFQSEKRKELLQSLDDTVSAIREDGLKLAELNLMIETQKKDNAIHQATNLQRIILTIIISSVIIALILGYVLSRTISNPIVKLREAATIIGSGKLDTSIEIKSEDEIGNLASTFKTMAENLKSTMVSKAYIDNIITSMMDSLVVVDLKGKIQSVNRALCTMLSYNEEELVGKSVQKIFAEEFRFQSELNAMKEKGYLSNIEKTYATKDGRIIPVLFSASPIFDVDGKIQRVVFVALDITIRKITEEKLKKSREQLRDLLAYFQSVREHERTDFAREIHDELGQSLTALKMDLHWLRKQFQEHSNIAGKTESMLKIIDKTIMTVKKICTELRPGVLDDLGLTAAIEWQAGEFEDRSGIICNLTMEPDEIIIDRDRSTAIFRIFQETITNVARHSNATEVKISLIQRNGYLEMEVKDNGRGIREAEIKSTKSFGLIGMKERTLLLGGDFHISGVQDEGTTVTLRVPA